MAVYICMLVLGTVKPCECVEEKKWPGPGQVFFTEHIAVFIRALSGSNTEKKWT